MAPHLLGEDEVKRAVRSYLKSLGYTQVRIKWGRAHGPDVRAKGPAGSLVLEAKGDASSQQHKTNNFVYALGQLVQRMDDRVVGYGLALPDNSVYRALVRRLPDLARRRLRLKVLFVARAGAGYAVTDA